MGLGWDFPLKYPKGKSPNHRSPVFSSLKSKYGEKSKKKIIRLKNPGNPRKNYLLILNNF